MKKKAFIPLALGLSMALGFWLGHKLNRAPYLDPGWNKLFQTMHYIEQEYVDSVSMEDLQSEVLTYLLQRLDPHSHFIASDEVSLVNESLDGGFEGIGIRYTMLRDSVYVINTIANGPAQKAGIKPGDRIVTAGDDTLSGKGVLSREVLSAIKGPSGTSVLLGIARHGYKGLLMIRVNRDNIPIESVDAVFKPEPGVLYIRIARFAKTTMDEFREKVYPLAKDSIRGVVLDLRGNGGGFLESAVQLADEFLPDNKLIVYTGGKSHPRKNYYATDRGAFEQTPLVVLIDGTSASASEIFAGAIQDHNRGLIVGRRSFGKGLVQEQAQWLDGSATRLTVARYYTPNGRSIQREYGSVASRKNTPDTAIRGGIVPDVWVSGDTAGVTWFYAELVHTGVFTSFIYTYRDRHIEQIPASDWSSFEAFVNQQSLLDDFKAYLIANGVEINEKQWLRSAHLIDHRLKAMLARSLFGDAGYYRINASKDAWISTALQALKNAERQNSSRPGIP
ncbi:MAG: S41 family peptidase [Salibacteraceae bacterium]